MSGGEPLQQRPAVTELLRRVKSETAFQSSSSPDLRGKRSCVSSAPHRPTVTPRPRLAKHPRSFGLCGRAHRRPPTNAGALPRSARLVQQDSPFSTDRYTLDDLESVPAAEVIVTTTGEVLCSGIEPARL